MKWVDPKKFFDQLGKVLDKVPPLPGEESMYAQLRLLLDAATQGPAIKQAVVEAALDTERDVTGSFSPYLRAYWGQEAILDGTWQPPAVKRMG